MDSLDARGVCLVTGGSRGVGKGIALALARSGFIVYITGRNVEALRAVADELDCDQELIFPVHCDHTVDEEVDKAFTQIDKRHNGRLDLLVNNVYSAAQFITDNSQKPFWDLPTDAWDVFNDVGLRNHYRCAVMACRMMVKRRSGLIINISSFASLACMLTPAYSIGKCANDRMASDCSTDMKKYNVAFISLWPGSVKTEHFIKIMSNRDSELCDSKEAQYFFQHGESPSFVGECVVHLLQDPHILRRTGQSVSTAEVARQCGLTDNGRRPVDFTCLKDLLKASGYNLTAMFIPEFIRIPLWMLTILLKCSVKDKDETVFA